VKHTRIIVTHYGGPDALQVLEEECTEPKHGEVRVRVQAAGVSLPDIMARASFSLQRSVPRVARHRRCTAPRVKGSGFNEQVFSGYSLDALSKRSHD
jgi:hypothetical protein